VINQNSENECIQLSLPFNSAYVSAARLTASSVANRMGFDTDEIEDIKAAVSESCTYIINKLPTPAHGNFQIKFRMNSDQLSINIHTMGILSHETDEMSLIMIKALMDEVDIQYTNEETTIKMEKNHKRNIF
jgi:serine/threonine-protein kinase RsbW